MSSGTVIGKMGVYLEQQASATVTTDTACILYYLSSQSLSRMETENPALASAFHKYMVMIISQRLLSSNTSLQAVQD